ncbi:hypothetical protein [Sphingomonas sp. LB2R24]|uniref:hypothetical protein n=1 Tax=Sphingomonas sorbitolis TaxID=3096165 RepID=UPI002FC8E2BB
MTKHRYDRAVSDPSVSKSTTSRPPTADFSKLIREQPAGLDELPSVHVSDGLGFRSIIRDGQISAEPCPVFDEEPLVYLFYGRPSYRVNSQVMASAIRAYAPVCFVLKPGVVRSPTRIFPFDSGAFHNELFHASMHRKMAREDFALEPDLASPQRLINLFFGDNVSYYDNKPIADVELPPLAFEASCYHGLITDRQENIYDERISSIEIQVGENVQLKDAVEAVVLPDAFLVKEVADSLATIGAEAIPYAFIDRLRPELYAATMYQIVRDYYRRRGHL